MKAGKKKKLTNLGCLVPSLRARQVQRYQVPAELTQIKQLSFLDHLGTVSQETNPCL